MIEEDDLPQAIFDYAMAKYKDQLGRLCVKYVEEFPEKDCDLPDGAWQKNFLNWLLLEKVLPETGETIAEEFAAQSSDMTPEMKRRVKEMRNMIRSDFLVISEKGAMVTFKDIHTKKIYNVKRFRDGPRYPLNTIVIGRIHPFGDHYRTTGYFFYQDTPFILDSEILMDAYESRQLERIEDIQLRMGSTFQSVMNKYPAHWVDWMCAQYQIHQRGKREKVRAIEQMLLSDLPSIVHGLPSKCKDVLRLCLANGGFVKYRMLKNYDDDFDFLWEETPLSSAIGQLR